MKTRKQSSFSNSSKLIDVSANNSLESTMKKEDKGTVRSHGRNISKIHAIQDEQVDKDEDLMMDLVGYQGDELVSQDPLIHLREMSRRIRKLKGLD